MSVRVGFLKLGNIGSAPLIELLLDERAERQDIVVRVVSSGAKGVQEVNEAEEVAKKILEFNPQLIVITSPNAATPGPTRAREVIAPSKIPTIIISDSPAKKALKSIEDLGMGYIIVEADAMIGARREFLDPIEMALFNADLVKVLSITGVYNILFETIDKAIVALKEGRSVELPRIVVDKEVAVKAAGFSNPYAYAKAMAAYEISRRVADLTVEACFKVKEWERYTVINAAAHEMMLTAAKLAEEAREIEKYGDTVVRKPHFDDGTILFKRKLVEKPTKQT